MIVRRFRSSDALGVYSLVVESWAKGISKYYSKKVIFSSLKRMSPEKFLRKRKGQLRLVAKTSEGIVGYISAHIRRNKAKIGSLYVSPRLMGKGIGTILYMKMEALIRKKGVRRIVVNSSISPSTVGFYEKNGFRALRRKRVRMGSGVILPVVKMEKSL